MLGSSATAQTPPARPEAETYPVVAAGVSAGLKVPYDTPDASFGRVITSVMFAIIPRLRLEGEWFAPASVRTTQDFFDGVPSSPYVLSGQLIKTDRMQGGAALLTFEFGSGRLRPFVGGGALFERHRVTQHFNQMCEPRSPGACAGIPLQDITFSTNHIDVRPQGAAGLNVRLTPRLIGFGALRIDDGLTVHGGARVVLHRRTVSPPVIPAVARGSVELGREQPDVRVVLGTGLEARGRLIGLSATAVDLRDKMGAVTTVPLADIRRIDRVTHRVRNSVLIGLVAGYAIGYFGSCGSGDEDDCWPEIGLMVGGAGAGAGALMGMIMNRNAANDGRDVIYLTPARGGLGVRFAWSFQRP